MPYLITGFTFPPKAAVLLPDGIYYQTENAQGKSLRKLMFSNLQDVFIAELPESVKRVTDIAPQSGHYLFESFDIKTDIYQLAIATP